MPDKNNHLPSFANGFLLTLRGAYCGTQVRQFHAYLDQQSLNLYEITPEIITRHLGQKRLLPKTARVYKSQLLSYLNFLFLSDEICFDPKLLRSKPKPLPVPEPARPFLNSQRGQYAGTAVRKFHKWLEQHELVLANITAENVKKHLDHRFQSISPSSGSIYRLQLFAYLEFLYGKNEILLDPAILRIKRETNPLPENSQLFLKTKSLPAKSTVRFFHKWLKTKDLELPELTPELINEFHSYRLEKISKISGKNSWYNLLGYLDFLHSKKEICFDPALLRKKPQTIQLPEHARQFIHHHAVVAKTSTVSYYKCSLRRFYKWLSASQLKIDQLSAFHMEEFAIHLQQNGLKAATRNGTLICIRVYFRWLNEHELLNIDADTLIKSETLPKLPHYLPRPFPQDIDFIIQKRLSKSQNAYQWGLLLMRFTGLRVGELINLEFNCLQYSHDNNLFLKVPLGKLNNERLVPIDNTTLAVIKKLQRGRPKTVTLLMENKKGRKTNINYYSKALKEACEGLELHGPAHTHRLRHSYATSMLNGGMSLVGLMKILGHNDHRMTLRYAAITTETVRDEYMVALEKIADRYKEINIDIDDKKHPSDPLKQVMDLIKWLQRSHSTSNPTTEKKISSIIKRLRYMETEFKKLMPVLESPK